MTCNDKYPEANNPQFNCQPPIIEDAVCLGSGSVILPGVRIGQGALVGAGAVVTKDVPPGMIVMGRW